jgi:hypothetical protein
MADGLVELAVNSPDCHQDCRLATCLISSVRRVNAIISAQAPLRACVTDRVYPFCHMPRAGDTAVFAVSEWPAQRGYPIWHGCGATCAGFQFRCYSRP